MTRHIRRDDPVLDLVQHAHGVLAGYVRLNVQARQQMIDLMTCKPDNTASDVAICRVFLATRPARP